MLPRKFLLWCKQYKALLKLDLFYPRTNHNVNPPTHLAYSCPVNINLEKMSNFRLQFIFKVCYPIVKMYHCLGNCKSAIYKNKIKNTRTNIYLHNYILYNLRMLIYNNLAKICTNLIYSNVIYTVPGIVYIH